MKISYLAIAIVLFAACGDQSETVKQTLEGEALPLGLYFGQSHQDVLNYCKDQNSKRLFFMSGNELKVTTKIYIEGIDSVQVDFWPEFDSLRNVVALPMKFYKKEWSPWSSDLQSEKLVPEIVRWVGDMYDCNDWKKVDISKGVPQSSSTCGNLKLSVSRTNPANVLVRIEDISRATFVPGIEKQTR